MHHRHRDDLGIRIESQIWTMVVQLEAKYMRKCMNVCLSV